MRKEKIGKDRVKQMIVDIIRVNNLKLLPVNVLKLLPSEIKEDDKIGALRELLQSGKVEMKLNGYLGVVD